MNENEKRILNKIEEIDNQLISIYLKGSKRDNLENDYWSDIDMLIVSGSESISEIYVSELDILFDPIQAKQLYEYENCITYRVTSGLESLIQYDLQIVSNEFFERNKYELLRDVKLIFGEQEAEICNKNNVAEFEHQYDIATIDNIWFLFYESVKKISRKDNLIGLHLILDLVREYLVLKMIDRDIFLGTNIHRYGKDERLPNSLEMYLLQTDSQLDKLKFILQLSKIYDSKLVEVHSNYKSRFKPFENHVKRSVSILEGTSKS